MQGEKLVPQSKKRKYGRQPGNAYLIQKPEYYGMIIAWRIELRRNELMFPLTTRAVQKQLALVCDYLGYEGISTHSFRKLGYEGISTHSFRKWYATEIYRKNGYDIALVQRLLQHSSAAVTQRYIGIEPQRIEKAIAGHAELL